MENLERTRIPNDVIMDYISLYKSIGINRHNHETLESDYDVMVRQTIRNDTYFFAKIFQLNVTDARFKSLVFKGVKPKNKEERLLIRVNQAFTKIHDDVSEFELLVSEVQDLLKFVYGEFLSQSKMQFRKLEKRQTSINLLSGRHSSTRESVERIVELFNEAYKDQQYEISYVATNFYIDFINIKPFQEKNDEIALLLLFILLISNGFEVFEYISFFEAIYKQFTEFQNAVIKSSFNWEMGYSQVLPLHQLLLRTAINAYETLNALVRDYEFDQHLNKSDNVENTITKLPDVFSKDDIRNVHPYISDSTINRTLKRLRDEKKIRPLGKGRSAKWMKLVKNENKKIRFEQLDLDI
jgi:hypothetical protein